MGLVLSAIISYAGVRETIECVRHILSGLVPDTDPHFDDLVEYYSALLRKTANSADDWTTATGQGYLCLAQDPKGNLTSAIKYYHGNPDATTTAILFSTKISSFGDSVEEPPQANGGYRSERYSPPSKTKTILTTTSDSFSVANRNKSPDTDRGTRAESSERERDPDEAERSEKLTWQYRPLSPTPEIQFQAYDEDKPAFITEDYLRSLDGIKYRPLQRSDPSNRRRSFKKRRSSSSNSSRESRASRDEELKMFTSLEEAELGGGEAFGSAPNLSARSHSRSRSREPKPDSWSVEGSLDAADEPLRREPRPEPEDRSDASEVIQEEEDFWGNSGD